MARENVVSKTSKVCSSFVSDVINFKALDNPPWRPSDTYPTITIEEMMLDILEFQRCFESQKDNINKDDLEMVKNDLLIGFIFRLNHEEDHGLGTKEETKESLDKFSVNGENINKPNDFSVKEKETLNIYQAYQYLEQVVDEECKEDMSLYGFIESSIVKELHKIILKNLPLPKNMTKPGVCSNNERFTTYQGKIYHYQRPDDMEEALNTILDRFNSLLNWLNNEKDELSRIDKHFKACSWLLFELLDLHPFADGNGRLFRLLCSYVLSLFTPFPTPVYNIWCDTDNYYYHNALVNALVNARISTDRHPRELTTMIIECNWYSWKEFLEKLNFC